jgi:ubiquinone/menaquinone biosynthesis C-methylase UbiE
LKVTNHHNRIIYRLWSPVYDGLFDRHFAAPGRKRALEVLNLQPGERVLIPGIGTGADLPLLPAGICALGIDLSPEMLRRAKHRLPLPDKEIALAIGDAQCLSVQPGSFDAAVLNLVLSVVPDGRLCFQAALRALKPGGRLVIFDKFAPDRGELGLGRKLLNPLVRIIGTDITRRFGDLTAGCDFEVLLDEPSLLGGAYRVILLRYNPP